MAAAKPDPWPWPDALDGPVAAPGHHRVLYENDRVRVLETIIRAGDRAPLHTHQRSTVMYVVSGSAFVRRDERGEVMLDTRTTDPPIVLGPVLWSDFNVAHTLENVGPDDLVVIGTELKD